MKTLTLPRSRSGRSPGQIIVIFAGAMILFVGLCAIVIDVSWYWANTLRMQRAADAAALAGVVWLPGNVTTATTVARAESAKNGYTHNLNGVTVMPSQDSVNNRRLKVRLEGDVGTFFARVLGISKWHAVVNSKAEYVLPVPMGSPENYYGVFGLTRNLTTSRTVPGHTDPGGSLSSGWKVATAAPATSPAANGWTASSGSLQNSVNSENNVYAQTSTNGNYQLFATFDLLAALGTGQTASSVNGIEVRLTDAFVSATCANSFMQIALSYDSGSHWTTATANNRNPTTGGLGTTTTGGDITLGSSSNLTAWPLASPAHTWTGNDLSNGNFRLRVTATKGCATAGTQLRLDMIEVRANYNIDQYTPPTVVETAVADVNLKGPGTACAMGVSVCYNADGSNLNPRGFWGTMNTQGAANINGDAFQPFYDTPTSGNAVSCASAGAGQACYDAQNYYNYAIEMASGSSGGAIYIYDPNFCSVATDSGTGDRWWGSGSVTSTYELYDTKNTMYDLTDDTLLATSGSKFANMNWSDQTMGGSSSGSPADCKTWTDQTYNDGRDYHSKWYRLYASMAGGVGAPNVYRLHTTSTDPSNANAQKSVNGENSFALYASASGTTPKLYGIGAMQAFTPLKAGSGGSSSTVQSEFYLAQIDQAHAGKSLQISLWDPGDTDPLTASLEILIPTSSGWSVTPVTYSATVGTTNSGRADGTSGKPNCATLNRTTASTSPINTYTSGGSSTTGKFNGCWLTIVAVIPTTYAGDQSGWWKIRYTMTGNGTSNDVTTWKADIRGNPVHLVLP